MSVLPTKIFYGNVFGIDLKFIDIETSGTPAGVFTELQRDDYGFETIQLTENDRVLDVGANIGMVSIYLKKKFNCKITAFEPVPLNFEHFKQNIILNGLSLDDFELHNTAITSKENQIIKIGTPPYNSGGSSIFHTCDLVSECKTETLMKYIGEDCRYLKIDTEGGEYEIIPSILAHLNNFKYIGIEYHRFGNNVPRELHELIMRNFAGTIFFQQSQVQ